MKNTKILLALGCLGVGLAIPARAITFTFQENGSNLILGNSSTFTESGISITASGFDTSVNPPGASALFAKFTSGDPAETGLGMVTDTFGGTDHEIDHVHFIQLDLSNLKGTTSALLYISSIQSGESGQVYYTKTAGSLAGATQILPTLLANGSVDITAAVNAGYFIDVTAGSGNVLLMTLSATAPTCTQSICGRVVNDANCDGKVSGTDKGIKGVTVTLKASNGDVVATTTTQADGSYCFPSLAAGKYFVVVTSPAHCKESDEGCVLVCWKDRNGRTCWLGGGCLLHWEDKDGTDCWLGKDGNCHWKDNDNIGKCHWRDKSGQVHEDDQTDESCKDSDGHNNKRKVCLAPCENKTVNFAFCCNNSDDREGDDNEGDDHEGGDNQGGDN
jgi:hypothetical protein